MLRAEISRSAKFSVKFVKIELVWAISTVVVRRIRIAETGVRFSHGPLLFRQQTDISNQFGVFLSLHGVL